MIIILFSLAFFLLCFGIYKRYYPVKGITYNEHVGDNTDLFVLDIGDYNEKMKLSKIDKQIPYAYLKRYSDEIPNKPLHVVAANRMERNLGIRFLFKKGITFVVMS